MAEKTVTPAKIIRPAASDVTHRQRLFDRLDQSKDKQVVFVSGPAGCGKTSLVSSYIEARDLSCLWFQVDSGDNDLATFFYYLGLAGKKDAPRRRKTLPLLTPEYMLGIPTFCQNFFSELFDRLTEPALVVFDNYQEASEAAPLHGAILAGLARLPQGIRIVIISRRAMPAPFSRLRANRLVERLGWQDLRFTYDEFESAIDLWGYEAPEGKNLKQIHQRADGWVAGLYLMTESSDTSPDDLQISEGESVADIFNLFAAETMAQLDKDVKDFLLKTSCLPSMTVDMARDLSENKGAGQILSYLYKNNYFIQRRTKPQVIYQFHTLFRSFLEKEATAQLPSDRLRPLQADGARLLAGSGQYEAAGALMSRAQDIEGMMGLIMSQAPALLQQGRSQVLQAWLQALPEKVRSENPWLQYWQGASNFPFDLVKAHDHFESAFQLFKPRNDKFGLLLSISGAIDSLMLGFFKFQKIRIWLDRFEKIVSDPRELPDNEVGVRVTSSIYAALVWGYSNHPDFKKWEKRALKIATNPENDQNILVNILVFGIFSKILQMDYAGLERILEKTDELLKNKDCLPVSKINILHVKSTYYLFVGQFGTSLKYTEEALALANKSGVHVMDFSLMAAALKSAHMIGDKSIADRYFQEMKPLLVRAVEYEKGYFYALRAHKEIASRNYEKALTDIESARAALIDIDCNYFGLVLNLLLKARVYIALGDLRNAKSELLTAKNVASHYNYKWHFPYYYFVEAAILFESKSDGQGLRSLQKAFGYIAENGFSYFGFEDHDFLYPLLSRALEAGIAVAHAQKMIQNLKIVPASSPIHIENWPWPLKVYTLGRFEIVRSGASLKSSGKAQQKPIKLLKVLISLGGRKVSDVRLVDFLWPDVDGDMQLKSLTTTLHRLRRLLGIPEAIVYKENRLTLDARYCWVDAWALERLLGNAAQAAQGKSGKDEAFERSNKALKLYKGGFLPQHLDEAWTIPMRERLKSKLLQAILRSGRDLEQAKKWQAAVQWYQQALDIDPLIEECYQRLIFCHQQLGHNADTVTVYERCSSVFNALLGIEPSEETKKIFKKNHN